MILLLVGRGRRDGNDVIAKRVHEPREPGDAASFSRSIPAFVHDDERDLPLEEDGMHIEHLGLEICKLCLEVVFLNPLLRCGAPFDRVLFWFYQFLLFPFLLLSFDLGLRTIFQGFYDRAKDFQDRIPGIGPLDQRPGGVIRVGLCNELIEDGKGVLVVPVEVPDGRCDEPCGARVSLPLFKPHFLHVLCNVQEEFQDDRPVVGQHPLERIDPFHPPLEGLLPCMFLPHLGYRPAVPAPGKDGHPPPRRCLEPEPPEERPAPLLLGRFFDGMERVPAGVERMDDLVDHPRDARGVPPFDDNHGRDFLVAEGSLEDGEPICVLRERLLVFRRVRCFCQVEFVEQHAFFRPEWFVHVFVGHGG